MTTGARKTATAKVSSLPIKQPYGVPAGRLLELQMETVTPEPYVVTDQITIMPPTKERADKIREQQYAIMYAQTMLNSAIANPEVQQEVLNALGESIKNAQNAFNEALFGDQYEDVLAFFADQPDKLWQAFEVDIQKQFFPSLPVSGTCPACGHVTDEEAAGKG